jgi:tetratricopeptide (TPR) repeat protein
MKHKKHLWIVVLTLTLSSVILVACGQGTPDVPPTSTPTATLAATPTPSASEHMALGMEHYEQGELDQAIAEFQRAIQIDPDFVEAHYNLGLAHTDRGEFDAAIAAYEEAIRLAPDLAEAHNGLGNVYFNQDKLEQALAKYEQAAQLDPGLVDAHFNLGHVYLSLDRYAEALAAYQEANRLNPGDAETLHNIGVAYVKQGMVSEASVAWEEALRANPDFAETHYTLGLAYVDLQRYGEAITQLNEALRLDPQRTRAYKHLGVAHYAIGQNDECIAAFETYLSLHPDDPDRESIEAAIAELQEASTATVAEYRNAEGGYGLLYPGDLYYDEDGAWAVFASSQTAVDAVFDYATGEAIQEAPVAMFDVIPLAELAQDLDLEEDAAPEEFLEALAASLEAETINPGSGMIGGFPGAVTEISGVYEETPYRGALAIILVEDRVIGGTAMALPDQWDDFYPIFAGMLTDISFFKQ